MSKFTVAGISIHKGDVKVRFCSDLVLRVKNLQKQGDTDIQLVELPEPMTKYDACQYLLNNGFSGYASDITEIMKKKAPKTAQPRIMAPPKVADTEIESIQELAVA